MSLVVLLRDLINTTPKESDIDIYHNYTVAVTDDNILMNPWREWLSQNNESYRIGISPNNVEFIEYLDEMYGIDKEWIKVFSDSNDFTDYVDDRNYGSDSDYPNIAACMCLYTWDINIVIYNFIK